MDDADDVVDPRAIDRHPRVLLVGDLVRGLLDRRVLGHRGDLRQRHHQLADLVLGELEHVRDHLALVGADLGLVGLRLALDQQRELVARDERLLAIGARDPRQQRRVAADDRDDRTQQHDASRSGLAITSTTRSAWAWTIAFGTRWPITSIGGTAISGAHSADTPRSASCDAEHDHRDERREVRADQRGRERDLRDREHALDARRRRRPPRRACAARGDRTRRARPRR